jgi:hypothetical protein
MAAINRLMVVSPQPRASIAWVELDHRSADTSPGAERFNSVAALLEAPQFDVVVIDGQGDHETVARGLMHLRATPAYATALIYLNHPSDGWSDALADGPVPRDADRIDSAWHQWLVLQQRFRPAVGAGVNQLEQTLLRWLWLRPGAWIRPVSDPGSSSVYRYPLVEAFANDPNVHALHWLEQNHLRHDLEPGELIDRIRQCPSCRSSRLNYVDLCPECDGLDIIREPSLHCFVCGHIGSQRNFLRNSALVCPNCLTQLRHIGSDYDRPMENYSCRSCQAFFVDAAVQARCLDCGQSHPPEALRVQQIRPFNLSESGRLACRHGLEKANHTVGDGPHSSLLSEAEFLRALSWQISIAQRAGRAAPANLAAILGLRLRNLDEVLASAGEPHGSLMLDSLIERLLEKLHTSDRCLHSRRDLIWLLLPQADALALAQLQKELAEELTGMQATSHQQLELCFSSCLLPGQLSEHEDAQLLLARLSHQMTNQTISCIR